MYTIGNPLIAQTMIRRDVEVGLNVPAAKLLDEKLAAFAALHRKQRLNRFADGCSHQPGLSKKLQIKNIMKAFIVDGYGKKERGRIAEMPEPELREDDVLVQIHAAGVNVLDSKIRDGEFNAFYLIASHSFSAMMWLGWWSKPDLECGDSSPAMRSMRGHIKIESVLSRNSFQ